MLRNIHYGYCVVKVKKEVTKTNNYYFQNNILCIGTHLQGWIGLSGNQESSR